MSTKHDKLKSNKVKYDKFVVHLTLYVIASLSGHGPYLSGFLSRFVEQRHELLTSLLMPTDL